MNPRLREVVTHLRRNDAVAALALLDSLADLPPADAARAHAWRAQALRSLGRAEEAAAELLHAIRFAKAEGDVEGLAALRALHVEISASIASLRVAEAGKRADAALLAVSDEELDAEQLLRKAAASPAPAEAERITRLALDRAGSAREIVLTHLALARITREGELVRAAHRVAEAADDQNLITAVAHAARALGVVFPPPRFR